MKVLLLTRSLHQGGAERQLVELARVLRTRGHDVVVVLFYQGGVLERELNEAGVRLRIAGKRGRWDVLRFTRRLLQIARAETPDVLYSMLPVPNILAVALKAALPSCRVIWGVRASGLDLSDYDWMNSVVLRIERMLAPRADAIIVNSFAGRDHLTRGGYAPSQLTVIPNGVDLQHFAFDAAGRARVRLEWNVRDDEVLAGIVARFDPMKDHATFFRAVAHVLEREQRWRFVCVGTGTEAQKNTVSAAAQRAGVGNAIIWAGPRQDMAAVYSALDICVLSSAYGEGFPNVLAEAMACGTPCVATDCGDCARIIQEPAQIVPARNAEALAAAMLRLAREPAIRSLQRARIAGAFSLERLADHTESVLWATG